LRQDASDKFCNGVLESDERIAGRPRSPDRRGIEEVARLCWFLCPQADIQNEREANNATASIAALARCRARWLLAAYRQYANLSVLEDCVPHTVISQF
jgi:hypothetical protein